MHAVISARARLKTEGSPVTAGSALLLETFSSLQRNVPSCASSGKLHALSNTSKTYSVDAGQSVLTWMLL